MRISSDIFLCVKRNAATNLVRRSNTQSRRRCWWTIWPRRPQTTEAMRSRRRRRATIYRCTEWPLVGRAWTAIGVRSAWPTPASPPHNACPRWTAALSTPDASSATPITPSPTIVMAFHTEVSPKHFTFRFWINLTSLTKHYSNIC